MKLVDYGKIKSLREARGLSQDELASLIRLSRPSLALVESGKKDLTISQLYDLSNALGVDAKEIVPDLKSLRDGYMNYDKFKQLIFSCIRSGGDTMDGKITKTKLAKLVYLADFNWFYKTRLSISGATYRAIQRGPVADEYFRAIDELYENGTIAIEPRNAALLISPNESYGSDMLTAAQLTLVEKICLKWQDRSTGEIVDFTHNQEPWKKTGIGCFITYESILAEKPGNLF